MARKYITAIAASGVLVASTADVALTQTASGQPPFVERWQSPTLSPPASEGPAKPNAATKPPSGDTQIKDERPPTPPVGIDQALYLIRTTLLTLNDANRSGNYSVLRDLAAPDFQARNSAADLALGFADLRRRNFDLFAAAISAPQLTAPPALDANKMLHLIGFFPTRPLQINFDLLFQIVGGQWRLFGVSVATPKSPAAAAQSKPAQQATTGPGRPINEVTSR